MSQQNRPGREHRLTAREAGLSRLSIISVLAGTVTAYGTFAVVAAITGAALDAADVDVDLRTDDWASSGAAAGLVTALVIFVAYLFGGYVAGRMARRSGLLHGAAVAILSIVVGAAAGAIARLADDAAIEENLRSIGMPTAWDQVESVAVFGAIASLVALVAGALLGGTSGERWHTRLSRRVVDPDRGPAAEARAVADRESARARELDGERDQRLHADPALDREHSAVPATDHRDGSTGDLGRDRRASEDVDVRRDDAHQEVVDVREDRDPRRDPVTDPTGADDRSHPTGRRS